MEPRQGFPAAVALSPCEHIPADPAAERIVARLPFPEKILLAVYPPDFISAGSFTVSVQNKSLCPHRCNAVHAVFGGGNIHAALLELRT